MAGFEVGAAGAVGGVTGVGGVGGAAAAPAPRRTDFAEALGAGLPVRGERVAPLGGEVVGGVRAAPRADGVQVQAGRWAGRVVEAQHRLDALLRLAESGRTFTPGELLAMQAGAYRSSQELDLAGKVVEKATGGVRQVLQTQL